MRKALGGRERGRYETFDETPFVFKQRGNESFTTSLRAARMGFLKGRIVGTTRPPCGTQERMG